ncbi:exonuclease SbcC [Microbacterium endophyticum]|uniref:Nuclease SbcCD subunit C n=1 Tax=Microbacterium endophyticum TaxID=1526412 RepID=A0A7W4YNR2_9MICO|nr:SMC family ATPase [Microbacterium endophyticum]MBB2975956.1 exonuclease SbcC [Microbacterium endophyticum]NIK37675.1 exonuclease SbcC [Microbacterium endophyticum]
MKLHRLELVGFGPFLSQQEVDFDAFEDDGIFLITGRTGAGKSSILDGVCFALYGGVPRYENGDKRVRSDHCAPEDPTRATLELTVGETRWRVSRMPEFDRPKKRGTGTTRVGAEAQLDELVDGAWIGRAAGPRDVGLALDDILGLTQQQFLQVILLAQGSFSRFLLAKNDERQRLLRTLFGTKSYEDYERILEQHRKDAELLLTRGGERLEDLLNDVESVIAERQLLPIVEASEALSAERRVEKATQAAVEAEKRAAARADEVKTAERERDAASRHREIHTTLRDAQDKRVRAERILADLGGRSSATELARTELGDALRAEPLRSLLTQARDAEERVVLASAAARTAADAWAHAGEHPVDERAAREIIDALTGDIALAQEARAAEEQIRATLTEQDALQSQHTAVAAAEAKAIVRRDAAAQRVTQATAMAGELVKVAALEPSARASRGELRDRLVAAQEAQQLLGAVEAADSDYVAANAVAQEASRAVGELLQRRLLGAAGELAERLSENEPCPVCGSLVHPDPAHTTAGDTVTDDMVTAAEERRTEAHQAEQRAADIAKSARDAHARASARAGGVGVDDLAVSLQTAEAELMRVEEAVAALERAHNERESAEVEGSKASIELVELREERVNVETDIARAADRLATAAATVESARAHYETVAERLDALVLRRQRARDIAETTAFLAEQERAAGGAVSERDGALAEAGFVSEDAASAALRPRAERERLAATIAEYDSVLRRETERVVELDEVLATAADFTIDVPAAEAAEAAAITLWTTAVAEAATATEVSGRMSTLAARAVALHAERAEAEAAHAVISRLANTVAGRAPNALRMTLEAFVLAAQLEDIVIAANLRLQTMSSGRYRLQHTDALARRNAASGLGLEVLDAHTGQARPPQSLSGGETFLASLALALGLAEVVTAQAGGIRLDTLFIDEGFGSLDAETLETAMRTLDELRAGGRTVGVISHVEAMKEQLPAQIIVTASAQGPSMIRHASHSRS